MTPRTTAHPSDEPLSGALILVVDDEDDYRTIVRMILEASGAQVVEATTASEAVTLLATIRVDLLVSDIGMPRRDGYALIKQIRATPEGSSVPAVALTGFRSDQDRMRALSAGFDVHLTKPLDAQALVAAVARLVPPVVQ